MTERSLYLRRRRALFWTLLVTQAAGAQFIIWYSLPFYQRLIDGPEAGSELSDFIIGGVVIVIMQLAYWPNRRVQRKLRFQPNTMLSHVFLWLGELSFIYAAGLAAVVVFERSASVPIAFWQLTFLAAMLFTIFCYKLQLEWVGDAMASGVQDSRSPGVEK